MATTEGRKLEADFVPKITDEDLNALREQFKNLSSDITFTVDSQSVSQGGQSDSSETTTGAVKEIAKTVKDEKGKKEKQDKAQTEHNSEVKSTFSAILTSTKNTTSKLHSIGSTVLGDMRDTMLVGYGAFNMMNSTVEKIWNAFKKASPELDGIVQTINNAFNLFLRPIGVAFAMELVPVMKDIYEKVFTLTDAMWDAYEEGGISAMIKIALENAIPLFLEINTAMWRAIPDDVPVLSAVRDLVLYIADWVGENSDVLVNVFEAIVKLSQFLIENIKYIVTILGAYIGYTIAKDAMGILGALPGATLLAVGVGATAGAGLAYAGMSALGFAEGGVVEPVDGGRLVRVAEGGEREYIIPQSKVESFVNANSGGNITNYFTVNGYTTDEVRNLIREEVDNMYKLSGLRGNFA